MFSSSKEAETAFYNAFSQGNVEEMKQVWAPEKGIICIHPSGPKLTGPNLVHRSWEWILLPKKARDFKLKNREIYGSDNFQIHTLEENIKIANAVSSYSVVYATNIYRKFQKGWLMVLHHASVAPEMHLRSDSMETVFEKGPLIH